MWRKIGAKISDIWRPIRYPPPNHMSLLRSQSRSANRVDELIMRGLVLAFDKVLYPMRIHGLGTIASKIARLRGSPVGRHIFEHGAIFLYPLYDSYWAYYLYTGRTYEPELDKLFTRLFASNTRFSLVDGGANFGYWSCFVSQRPDLVQSIIAIEPTPDTFAILSRNSAMNGGRISCVQAAISDSAGIVHLIVGAHHAGNRIAAIGEDHSSLRAREVRSVTVDSVVEQYCSDAPLVIIKLDVEGFEPQAFAGARRTLEAGNPVIYECHGSDRESSATCAALDHQLAVYFLAESGESIRISDVKTLTRMKTNPKKGYNLVAVRPGSRFESLMGSQT